MKLDQRGMTLIEIMIVLVILGGMASLLATRVFESYTRARVKEASIQLDNIKNALRNYALDCGSFPPQSVGLEALLHDPGSDVCKNWGPSPYIDKKQLKDPFNHEFIYEIDNSKIRLTFLGQDGKPGGKGYDEDLTEEEDLN